MRVQRVVPKGFVFDVSYAWSDRRVNGIDGRGARPQAIGGTNVFVIVGYALPLVTLTGFAYLVDQDELAVQGYRQSSQTYGARLAGTVPLSKTARISYAASFAQQSDYGRNPNRYAADYWLGEATLTARAVSVGGGYEILGADKGIALTSVQTPLASLFKFQGWADKFTTTPPNGIRNLYSTISVGWKNAGPADLLRLSATVHRFDSDRLGAHYGDELDLRASAKRWRTTVSLRLARYRADSFATDTDKIWLTAEWVY